MEISAKKPFFSFDNTFTSPRTCFTLKVGKNQARDRTVCVERKHWQTQMAHWKIHQHGKLLRFPHTVSRRAARERARVVRNQHNLILSYIFKCWEQMPD